MFEIHCIRETKSEKVVEKVKNYASIEPNLAILFIAGILKNSKNINLDCNSIVVPVEGIITPTGFWSQGILALLTDSEVSIQIFKGSASEVYQKIKTAKKENFNLLIYPMIFIKSRLSLLKTLTKLKRTSELEKVSKVFEEIIYPMNTMLRPFRDEDKTAVAINLFPLNIGIGIPKIFLNGKAVDRGVLNISFKDKISCEFTDIFPEKGKSFEETAEILSQELINAKIVDLVKKGLAIKEIDGKSVKEFLNKQGIKMRGNLKNDLEDENFFGATPYGLWMISKETFGSSMLGLMDYDLRFYPSLFEADIFYDKAIFGGEFIKGGMKRIVDNIQESDFAIIDQNLMLMFEERIVEITKILKGYGILSLPSFTGKIRKNFMSEVEKNLCVNATESMAFLKLN